MAKPIQPLTRQQIDSLVEKLIAMKKYRGVAIPRETLKNLVEEAATNGRDLAQVEETARLKLHNLAALYLGDPDYASLTQRLTDSHYELSGESLREVCLEALKAHASTAERIPFLAEFYQQVFAYTGQPDRILDLACGLNPFAIPWMNLSAHTEYLAYDLNLPRVQALNQLLISIRQPGRAFHQDILVSPPQEPADIAFFFKEAHRFEQRKKGCNRDFFAALPVKILLISLPKSNLTGSRDMLDHDRALIAQSVADTGWQVDELIFENEIVFGIRKTQ